MLTIVILCFCQSCSGKTSTFQQSDSDFLTYNGNFHEEIIKPEVEAWKKVAVAMYPRVCDDTETQWAAAQVDSMANALLLHPDIPKGEQIAKLYEIQNMTAYGMSYFAAIIGSYSNPGASRQALRMMQDSYAEIDSLTAVNYDNAHMLVNFEQSAYLNFGLFMELGTQYTDGAPQFVLQNQQMNAYNIAKVNELFNNMSNETQAYRYATLIDNTTFFMTYCPLTFWLTSGTDFQQIHQSQYIEIGTWFDKQVADVNRAIDSNNITNLSEMSSSQYTSMLKQAATYRTQIIRLLADGIMLIDINKP